MPPKPEVLEHAHIEKARGMVVAISDAAASRRVAALARQLNPSLHVIVRTRYILEVEPLYKLGVNEVIPEEFETSVEILSRVLRNYLVPQDEIERCIADVRSDGYDMLRSMSRRHSHAVGISGYLSGAEIGDVSGQKRVATGGKEPAGRHHQKHVRGNGPGHQAGRGGRAESRPGLGVAAGRPGAACWGARSNWQWRADFSCLYRIQYDTYTKGYLMFKNKFILILIAVFVVLPFISSLLNFYTDWLFFVETGFTSVFTTTLTAKIGAGLFFGVLLLIFALINLYLCEPGQNSRRRTSSSWGAEHLPGKKR